MCLGFNPALLNKNTDCVGVVLPKVPKRASYFSDICYLSFLAGAPVQPVTQAVCFALQLSRVSLHNHANKEVSCPDLFSRRSMIHPLLCASSWGATHVAG